MSELDESQKKIAETLDGMVVVDAGPGTGKTHTIVRRYVNLVSREDVKPRDVLMLTFTKNAASEMEERIKNTMMDCGLAEDSKLVQVKTFDAFCLSVVMESPEEAGKLFGIEEKLTHSARLVENETLNRAYFSSFIEEFLDSHGADYGDWGAVASQHSIGIYGLINRLMARGIFPLRSGGWFGGDDGRELTGDTDRLLEIMRMSNAPTEGSKGGLNNAKILKNHSKMTINDYDWIPEKGEKNYDDRIIVEAATDDRRDLIRLVHDVFWNYVKRCISDDRLTFGVTSMLAFSILYSNGKVREQNSYRYIMIDEFQDTNAGQLMTTLMILSEPNLCVVGDWKQGIYGFRFVSIENIIRFEKRAVELRKQLNDDGIERVAFRIPEVTALPLKVNYRSSQVIVDKAFDCMTLKATDEDIVDVGEVESNLTLLTAAKDESFVGKTSIRYVKAAEKDAEPRVVADCIRDYVGSGNYAVVTKDGERPMRFGDIAVLCRSTRNCIAVKERLDAEGIPSFLQGEVNIMSTRQGKLALAWLRYVNNSRDPWGYIPIMADLGYPMSEMDRAKKGDSGIPDEIKEQRRVLYEKRRRPTDLLTTMYEWYGIDDDISQAIINVLSDAHRGSLLTLSDLITIIEDDIESEQQYSIEVAQDPDTVVIMTMHKSKGLQFPAVILPFIDSRSMPSTKGDYDDFRFDPLKGIRSKNVVGRFGDYSKICRSWKTKMVDDGVPKNYDEERRLMFVAMSRAQQYETLICGGKPSKFMTALSNEEYSEIPYVELPVVHVDQDTIVRPDVSGYKGRARTTGVHSVMRLEFEEGDEEADEPVNPFKGKEYGTDVHREAKRMHDGVPPSGKYPESGCVADMVLSRRGIDGFIHSNAELDCTVPLGGTVLRGTIDLLMVFEDRVEIHDYKTDETDRFENEYRLQLSIYAAAVSQHYSTLPVRCFIDYVSLGKSVEFQPMDIESLGQIVTQRLAG